MQSTLAERLKEAMKGPPRVTGAALARACKVKAPSVSDWLTGKTKSLEGQNLLSAARCLGVDPNWLATGVGLMRPALPMTAGEPGAAPYAKSAAVAEAIALLYQLSPMQLDETISFLRWQLADKAPPRDGQALPVAA